MENLLTEPVKTISANPWGALWIVTVILAAWIVRALWNEIVALRKAADAAMTNREEALAKKDALLEKERADRISDLRTIERLQDAVESLGDKLLDVAARRRA